MTTPGRPRRSRQTILVLAGVAVFVVGIGIGIVRGPLHALGAEAPFGPEVVDALRYTRLDDPGRTVATAPDGRVVATFTDGSRTVNLTGPDRTFAEPDYTDASVQTSTWVRVLPRSWEPGAEDEGWVHDWLDDNLGSDAPDVLEIATQYFAGAPEERDDKGVAYRGDAGFGPASDTDQRLEKSDFYDYLGVDWTFPDGVVEKPEADRYRDVDCSGFVRLVYGYRSGIPLRGTNDPGVGLPRRAYAIERYGPGTEVIGDNGTQITDFSRLQPGDLLFFNIDAGPQIDHVAIYLGVDSTLHHRFISSRATVNGPTMGDIAGTSVVDDGGYYSRAFRAVRRL